VSGRPHQLALPASVWDQTTSVHGAVTESFGGQRVTGLSPKHANAGEARPGRLCPCPPRPPWTWRRRRPDTSRVVSWGKTDLLRLRAQARPSTSRLRVRKDGADQGRPTACLAGTEGFAGVSRTQEGRDAGPGRARGSEPTAEVPPAESRREPPGGPRAARVGLGGGRRSRPRRKQALGRGRACKPCFSWHVDPASLPPALPLDPCGPPVPLGTGGSAWPGTWPQGRSQRGVAGPLGRGWCACVCARGRVSVRVCPCVRACV